MYKGKKIGVVVPCYNEETQIGNVIETMPAFVDSIIVVDDCSLDDTIKVVEKYKSQKTEEIIIISHNENRGVGAAISSGYIWCRDNNIDIAVVMAGDGQMDPVDLENIVAPVAEGKADYSKGNRLITGEAFQKIPKVRYFGNACLTLMTKVASGYWHVTDSQTGYTALNKKALHLLPIDDIYPGYGMPNDFLVTLNIYSMRVVDVPVNPLYGVGEQSNMVIHRNIISLLKLMMSLFIRRMVRKYVIRDFHPLIFFYITGFILFLVSLPLMGNIALKYFYYGRSITAINGLATGMTLVMALQFLFFAMWMDMDYNRTLNPHK